MTYNIKSGIYHPDGLEAVARVLEEAAPQLIALQEVDRDTRRSGHEDQTAWLARRLGMEHFCFGAATPWEGGGEYGVALISSYPLLEPSVTSLWVPAAEGGDGIHVPHGLREPRIVLSARVVPKDQLSRNLPVTVMVTHLGLSDEQRLRQAEQLVELAAAAETDERVLLAGDFNGRPDSPEVRTLTASLEDSLGHLPERERVTFPSGDPEMHGEDFLARTIDYILVGGGLRVQNARIIADYSLASDHNPCEATISLP